MSVAVKKLQGVESVDVSLEKSSAVIVLKPDNTVSMAELRRVIRNAGYPTRDAQVTARGRIIDRGGKPMLDLLNGTALELTEKPRDAATDIVEVGGVSRSAAKDSERLTVATVKQSSVKIIGYVRGRRVGRPVHLMMNRAIGRAQGDPTGLPSTPPVTNTWSMMRADNVACAHRQRTARSSAKSQVDAVQLTEALSAPWFLTRPSCPP